MPLGNVHHLLTKSNLKATQLRQGCKQTPEGLERPQVDWSLDHSALQGVSQDYKTGCPKLFLGVAKYFRGRGRIKCFGTLQPKL